MKKYIILMIGLFFITTTALADFALPASSVNVGDFSDTLFGVAVSVTNLIKFLSFICGTLLVFFSIQQYGRYKRNPVETTISTVIITLVIGLALIALTFVPFKV